MMPEPGQSRRFVKLIRLVMYGYGIVLVAQLGALIVVFILAHPLKSLVLIAAFGSLTLLFAHTSQLLTFIATKAHRLHRKRTGDNLPGSLIHLLPRRWQGDFVDMCSEWKRTHKKRIFLRAINFVFQIYLGLLLSWFQRIFERNE